MPQIPEICRPTALVLGAILLCLAPAAALAQADVNASDLHGRWKDEEGNAFTFQSTGNGEITMRVIDSATRKNMHFKGQFNAEGFVISAPVASVSNIAPVIPLTVRRQALAQHPDIKYWYDVKPVDRNTIELTNHIHSITRSGDTLSSVNLDVEQVKLTLSRVGGLPDLNLVAFTTELKGSGNSAYRILRATVENSGDADLAKEYLIKIWYYTKDISPDPGPLWRTVSYTPSLRPPLRKGERTVVEWRTDTKTETGGTPFLPDDAVVMKAEVDPDLDIKESVETNNYRMLHKICVPPDAPENTGGNKEDWVDRGEMTLDEMAKQVLCHIKREAKELAREDKGTVRDSRFLAYLRTAYLRKYLARPTIQSAKEMIEEIGKPVVKLETLAGALDHRLFVPAAFRQKYAGKVPEYLYVATDVLNQLNTPKSKILKGETVLDVSFLLGKENYGAEDLSDWQNGGKNWSNVMHWATGLKYYDLPPTAMQELFLGYEYWHMEGFDRFGEDAINDLIAEEQGRLLGRELVSGRIRNLGDFVSTMDQTFRQARAWVGAILRLSQERLTKSNEKRLDFLALYPEFVPTDYWQSGSGYVVRPWTFEKGGKTIKGQLMAGSTIEEVNHSQLVLRLIPVYGLIYEADEWEKKNGKIQLTPVIRKIINGGYDAQFKAAPKDNDAEWVWKP